MSFDAFVTRVVTLHSSNCYEVEIPNTQRAIGKVVCRISEWVVAEYWGDGGRRSGKAIGVEVNALHIECSACRPYPLKDGKQISVPLESRCTCHECDGCVQYYKRAQAMRRYQVSYWRGWRRRGGR